MVTELEVDKKGTLRWRDTEDGTFISPPEGVIIASNVREAVENVHGPGMFETASGPELPKTRLGLFKQTIKTEDLRELFYRDEFLYSSVELLSQDLFSKGFTITAFKKNGEVHQDATDRARALIAKVGLLPKLRVAFRSRMVHGVSVVLLVKPGAIDSPPRENATIRDVRIVPWDNITDFRIDFRPNSASYGHVVGVEIQREVALPESQGTTTSNDVIHDGRFIHWPVPDLDASNPYGMSKLQPLHDLLTVKKNVDWSLGEALYQFVAGKAIFLLPSSTSDETYKKFKKAVKDMNVTTSFVAKGAEEVEVIRLDQGRTGLDPEPFTHYFMSLMTIGLGTMHPEIFSGLTGAAGDILQRRYANSIRDIRENEINPVIEDFLELSPLPTDTVRWEIEWPPFTELTAEEESFIKSRLAMGRQLTGRAVGFFIEAGASVEFDHEGWITRVFSLDPETGEESLILSPPEPLPEEPQVPPEDPFGEEGEEAANQAMGDMLRELLDPKPKEEA